MAESPSFSESETKERQPTRLRDLKLISRLTNTVFAIAVLAMVGYAASVAKDFMTIGNDLRLHMSTVVRKGDLLNHLRGASGYGGFIHNFKNYVLRLEDFRPHQLKADLYTLFTSISDYRTLGLSPAEEDALDQIEKIFRTYETMIPRIAELNARGFPPGEIDGRVKVDDTAAKEAFGILQSHWVAGRERYSETLEASVATGLTGLRYAAFVGLPAFVLVGLGLLWFQRRLVNEIQAYAGISERLRMANALNEAVLDSVSYAIIGTESSGRINIFNRAASNLLGYEPEEVIGKIKPISFHDAGELAERAAILSKEKGIEIPDGSTLFRTMIRCYGAYTGEWKYVRKDGTIVPVLLSLAPIDRSGDPALGVVGIAYDITERKKLDNMQREFVSTVNHELRTPLTSIAGSLALVRGGAAGDIPEKAGFLIEIAHKNSERLILLVNDILDIERLETGRMTFRLEETNLTDLVEEAVSANEAYASARGIALEITEKEDAVVRVDKGRILQVLANLLSNAAKFSPDGAVVDISVRTEGDTVRVAVADHGIGIPKKYQDKVFERFWQVDATDSRAKQGTGLGLSIAKAIIQRLGGEIGAGTTPGGGATFHFTLPRINV